MSSAWTIFSFAMMKHRKAKVLYCLNWKIIFNYIDYSEDISENLRTSIYGRFTYIPDFIPKPRRKIEYQDNASLLKDKGNPSYDTITLEICLRVKDLTRSKELRPTTCTSGSVHMSENDINV